MWFMYVIFAYIYLKKNMLVNVPAHVSSGWSWVLNEVHIKVFCRIFFAKQLCRKLSISLACRNRGIYKVGPRAQFSMGCYNPYK